VRRSRGAADAVDGPTGAFIGPDPRQASCVTAAALLARKVRRVAMQRTHTARTWPGESLSHYDRAVPTTSECLTAGLPAGGRRLTLARAMLGGSAAAAMLPTIVRSHGGDAVMCLHLGAFFAVGTLVSELPAALLGDREGEARVWLRRAGLVQALALIAIALAPDVFSLAMAVVVAGIGAGLATGAEARASLAIGRDARSVARLEVVALLAKGTACFAIALLATALGIGARGAVMFSASLCVVAAFVASTVRAGDRVRDVARGRRREDRPGDRRSWISIGVLALVGGVAALSLVARGTDALDAFTVTTRGGGLLACAAILTAKGAIARALAPSIARARMNGVAFAAALAALPLIVAPRLPAAWIIPTVALACGIAGGAAAAARGVLLVRLGASRVGTGAAIEATVRRLAIAFGALCLAPVVRTHGAIGPYAIAGAIAIVGGLLVLVPRGVVRARKLRELVTA
jgi:hypothetical protein